MMDHMHMKDLLEKVAAGAVSPESALEQLKSLPYEDMGFAKVDHHRALRTGYPEAIYCEGKTPAQAAAIAQRLAEHNANILATRASREVYEAVREKIPDAIYHELPRLIVVERSPKQRSGKVIAVVSAGTSDMPVAEEAAVTAEVIGNKVDRVYDVGVAGIHRLLARGEQIRAANVVIVVAGMEGALASVVGGLVDKPVIAVPTSVGYGASFGGVAALLAMLNSCATGIGVVNIDNGFGAGYLASNINRL